VEAEDIRTGFPKVTVELSLEIRGANQAKSGSWAFQREQQVLKLQWCEGA